MKFCILLFALVGLVAAETYNTDHDDLDVQQLVGNIKNLQAFLDCFIDKQPCDEIPGSFKLILAESVQQACAKCSEPQKYLARRFLEALKEKLPQGYIDFKNKYDPEDKYFTTLERTLANIERS